MLGKDSTPICFKVIQGHVSDVRETALAKAGVESIKPRLLILAAAVLGIELKIW